MKKILIFSILLFSIIIDLQAQSVWSLSHLSTVKQSLEKAAYSIAYQKLIQDADSLLNETPLSVMMKERIPVSGNKHDYMSQARYFWPDPNKPDGLPYINRDGISNPELNKLDRDRLGKTADRIITLSLAWYFSGKEKYAQKATEIIRVWFFNKDTYMNPNLNYAQMIPGHNGNKGRCYGVLDTYSFIEMLDAVQLLGQSQAFTKSDSKRLKIWFGKLLSWLLISEQGQEESKQANNHSTAYDAQIIAYALYSGKTDIAKEFIEAVPDKRIFTQIESDGKQPHELTRTLAFGYSQYNLTHLIDIFLMAKKLNINIDNATSPDGRNFYKAMDFLAQYMGKDVNEWPYKQISDWNNKQQEFCKDLYRVYTLNTERTDYLKLYKIHRKINWEDRFLLLYGQPDETEDAYAFACKQFIYAMQCANKAKAETINKKSVSPRSINKDGSLRMVPPHDWCSGFFPGSLWQIYAYTHTDYWRQQAISFTWPIEEAKWNKGTHDLGFMMYNSFGKAYELTGERSYKDVALQAAKTLITRYNDKVGSIRSWDHNSEHWKFPVIIDNMMNLELLFWATKETGDSIYYQIAAKHANTTLRNHFRKDNSSYHVVDYDPNNGLVRLKCTHQGYSDDSFWSRGQSWGLYGFTMCYRFTKDPSYLKQAENIASFFFGLANMPEDGIPYWDMKDPNIPNSPRDASAAAIFASGLYELSNYVTLEKGEEYKAIADKIINNLHKSYQSIPGTNYGFLLLHSTGHHPGNDEIDVPIAYADYYYLEALQRKAQLENQ